jgi:hypothetical protein
MLRNTTMIGLFGMLALGSTGCFGVTTGSNGALGRLSYSLYTDYETDQDELTALPLLTGYRHDLHVDLTPQGEKDANGDEHLIVHRGPGVESERGEDEGYVPSLSVQVDAPGSSTIESMLHGVLFDRLVLKYDDPTHLDVVTWIREPWAEEWAQVNGPLVVSEGTQVSFLAIPMADDVRLGGEFTAEITVDDPALAVADAQILAIQEGGMTGGVDPESFYTIEPGTATFTFRDPVHGVEATRVVEIEPIALP